MADALFREKVFSSAKLSSLVSALAEKGGDADAILRDSGLTAEALDDPSTRISREQLLAAYAKAAELIDDPAFAFQLGGRTHLSAFGMYGYAMLCSTVYRRTFDFAQRYHELATPVTEIALETGDRSTWTITPIYPIPPGSRLERFVIELQIGIHLSLHRDVMGDQFDPQLITLAYPAGENPGLTSELAGIPVLYDQPRHTVQFDGRPLDEVSALGHPTTFSEALRICDDLLRELRTSSDAAHRVRSVLLRDLANRPSFEQIAKMLGDVPRTLRRQLQQEGMSYRQLLSDLLARIAIKYLRETSLTNEEIAFALGFSDSANFRHAFRRWTGRTPGDFRRHPGIRRAKVEYPLSEGNLVPGFE